MILLVLPTVPSSLVSHFFLCDAENKFAKGKEQDNNEDNNDNNDKENSRGDVKPCFKKAKVSTTVESNSATLGFHKNQMWMPNYALAMWKDHKLKKQVTICILFDGGVNLDEDDSAVISKDGTKLKIKCKGIKRLNDVDTLHEYHRTTPNQGLPEYHPQVIAFQEFFQVIKTFEIDSMYNEATIFLPFPIQGTFLEETRLEDQYKSLTLYLQMIAIEDHTFSAKKKTKMEKMVVVPKEPLIT
jgi:hypothetical protein